MKKKMISGMLLLALLLTLAVGCAAEVMKGPSVTLENIPEYSGAAYVAVNDNEPYFTQEEITDEAFETYSDLDALGRCGVTCASVGLELMPTEERGDIGSVKPTGWHSVRYNFVDGKSLYNRCHLIGYQLSGENANERNLITGTRYLNVDGMLPFENMVADYVKETKNHVMYRVTPVFGGNELVARGVLMEGYSVEDDGDGICFNVFCYNVQPKVKINYATGESSGSGEIKTAQNGNSKNTTSKGGTSKNQTSNENQDDSKYDYILNMNTHKFHLPGCRGVKQMSEANKGKYKGSREEVIEQGYEPCKICNP